MEYGTIEKIDSGQAAEDIPIFDGTNWLPKGGTEKIKIIVSSRNLADETSTVPYTGLGFKPSYVRIMGNVNNTTIMSEGATELTSYGSFSKIGTVWQRSVASGSDFVSALVSVGNSVAGKVDSFDSDGLTITWTKTGSPTGTFNFVLECFR